MKKNVLNVRVMPVLLIVFLVAIPQLAAEKGLINQVRQFRIQNETNIINEFIRLLSIPNVSSDRENIRKNAVYLKQLLNRYGLESVLIETKGNPVVYGELLVPGAKKTLMFYVHYDGQPVDPSKWSQEDPFKPVLRTGKIKPGANQPAIIPLPDRNGEFKEEWRLYARSSSDDKAPVICLLAAIKALKTIGIKIKNNLKFLFDGEEEAGSPSMRDFLQENKQRLDCDLLFFCDGPVYFSNGPTLFFGVRGITSVEITVYGATLNLHSGHYGNWAPNPVTRLAALLSSMKNPQGQILINGFYDTVIPLTSSEKRALSDIPGFENRLMELYGFSGPENPGKSLMETLQSPSLNIHGIRSGWTGQQARTIVPAQATASLDIRLVKGNVPADMVNLVVEHIKNQGYRVVAGDPDNKTRQKYPHLAKVSAAEKGYPASRTSMDLPLAKAVIQSVKKYYPDELVLIPTLGGSLPIYLFNQTLGVPTIGIPIANYDNNQHQSDENIRLGNFWRAIEVFAAVIQTAWQ